MMNAIFYASGIHVCLKKKPTKNNKVPRRRNNITRKKQYCAGPENIHTPPTEGIEISWGVGDSVRPKI